MLFNNMTHQCGLDGDGRPQGSSPPNRRSAHPYHTTDGHARSAWVPVGGMVGVSGAG